MGALFLVNEVPLFHYKFVLVLGAWARLARNLDRCLLGAGVSTDFETCAGWVGLRISGVLTDIGA